MQQANQNTKPVKFGVIGGSGFYHMQGLKIIREHAIDTPFGKPSDLVMEADIAGRSVYFLPRHGRGHRFTPSEVNYRANIYALKSLQVTHVLAVSAVGIMREEIRPGDMVIPDQIFDRTKGIRASTFFGDGVVGHIEFADPFGAELRQLLIQAAKKVTQRVYVGGTAVCMEGPAFSTRAESHQYRATLQPSVIGMTSLPEAKLAREAELCYAMLALATDYDCWNAHEGDVSVEAVLKVLKDNTQCANQIVLELAKILPETSSCKELFAARFAIMTDRSMIPSETKKRLELLYGQYFNS
ncbi:MAG: S-methyl-5'-thioadenosine phosphorylase [Oligoflexales bacterium]|nr:S-methyl-5'-thioadenosine phosphorylase [Oligoflexales bacterium]